MSFKRLDPEDFILSSEAVTAALWTGYVPKLATLFTSSVQEATTGQYYLSVYQTASLISVLRFNLILLMEILKAVEATYMIHPLLDLHQQEQFMVNIEV